LLYRCQGRHRRKVTKTTGAHSFPLPGIPCSIEAIEVFSFLGENIAMAENEDGEIFEKEIKTAIRDTGILLEYLAREPNARLQTQFKDTRDRAGSSTAIPIAPPCEDYSEFLNRLTEIRSRYAEKTIISEDVERDASKLSNKAFLFWSRDFLSGLASPATAETIQITNAFVEMRFPKERLIKITRQLTGMTMNMFVLLVILLRRSSITNLL
jgi:hypothetical protein